MPHKYTDLPPYSQLKVGILDLDLVKQGNYSTLTAVLFCTAEIIFIVGV